MTKMICYCYQYTEKDIITDVVKNQRHSTILESVIAAKQAGDCQCSEKHPEAR